jgi:GRAM domain-containing protein 4
MSTSWSFIILAHFNEQAYWVFWFYDLLLPALILRMLFALLKRRVFSYPTLQELKERRHEVDRAHKFGEEVSARFSASSTLGFKEIWRIGKVFKKTIQSRTKNKIKECTESDSLAQEPDSSSYQSEILQSAEEKQIHDFRNMIVEIMNEIADLHERIKKYGEILSHYSW